MVTAKDTEGRTIIWNEVSKQWKYPTGRVYHGELPEYCLDDNQHPVEKEMIEEHFKKKKKVSKIFWWKFW